MTTTVEKSKILETRQKTINKILFKAKKTQVPGKTNASKFVAYQGDKVLHYNQFNIFLIGDTAEEVFNEITNALNKGYTVANMSYKGRHKTLLYKSLSEIL